MRPILLYMGEHVKHMGENGKGLVMKICHNALVSQIQNGVNETLALAARNGISVMDYAEAVSYGGGQNFYLDSKKGPIEEEDYTTAFSVEKQTGRSQRPPPLPWILQNVYFLHTNHPDS